MSDFPSLKAEQIERIKMRDSFVNLSIVSIGIMISAAFASAVPRVEILLAIPWVAMAFGWSFVLNDVKISRLASYFASNQGPSNSSNSGWEVWRRSYQRSWLESPIIGALVQLLIFVCPGLVSIVVYFCARKDDSVRLWEVSVGAAGVLMLILLSFAVFSTAQIRVGKQ